MQQAGIKDPNIALDPKHLFELPDTQSDSVLIRAFSSYNKLRTKVVLEGELVILRERNLNWIQRAVGAIAGEKK
jgi:hypothetical protein